MVEAFWLDDSRHQIREYPAHCTVARPISNSLNKEFMNVAQNPVEADRAHSAHAPIRVAFVGSAGIPNRYGGFEAFVDRIGPALIERGFRVAVTCDRTRYAVRERKYRNVDLFWPYLRANGATSPLHDLLALLLVAGRADIVVLLGSASAGLLLPFIQFIYLIRGTALVVNVDGLEWRRAKFSPLVRGFLRISDATARIFCDAIIVDNVELLPFLPKRSRAKAWVLAYPACERPSSNRPNAARSGALTVCRVEPENNCHILIEAFLKSRLIGTYTFVGNFEDSEYGRRLLAKYGTASRVRLLKPIYDEADLDQLRDSCTVYLHGHSVGGSNPSLIDMLQYHCSILAFDVPFNRATAGGRAQYFQSVDQLVSVINDGIGVGLTHQEFAAERYSVGAIADQFASFFRTVYSRIT